MNWNVFLFCSLLSFPFFFFPFLLLSSLLFPLLFFSFLFPIWSLFFSGLLSFLFWSVYVWGQLKKWRKENGENKLQLREEIICERRDRTRNSQLNSRDQSRNRDQGSGLDGRLNGKIPFVPVFALFSCWPKKFTLSLAREISSPRAASICRVKTGGKFHST